MNENLTINEIMNYLNLIAMEKWGKSIVDEIQPVLKRIAEAIFAIDKFQLESEQEPVFPGTIFNYLKEGE